MRRITFSFIVICVSIVSLTLVSCRPRASRSRSRPQGAQNTAPTGQAVKPTVSIKAVMDHADSAMSRIQQLDNGPDADIPPVATTEDYSLPRTVTGLSYVPTPNLGSYGAYEAALAAYNARQYDQAIGLFSQVVVSGQPSELVPNAYYWMGESYYAMDRYQESMPYFEYVSKIGPQYKRSISLYKLSRANLNLGNRQAANMWYERLRNEYPTSSYARKLAKLGTR